MNAQHSQYHGQRGIQSTSLASLPDRPLVTVVVTNYNHGEFIEDTIRSILNQDYEPIELIVVDGGSTDGTLDILQRYKSDPRVRWISEPDDGTADAFLKGVRLARGDLVTFQTSNDIFLPGAFRALVEEFVTDPQLGMVGGWYSTIDVEGNPTPRQRLYRQERSEITVDDVVHYRNMPACLACLWRRDLIITDGLQDDLAGADITWQLSFLLAVVQRGARMLAIPNLITSMRFHPNYRGIHDTASAMGGDPRGPLGVRVAINAGCMHLVEKYKDFLSTSQARALCRFGLRVELSYRRSHYHQTISLIPALLQYTRYGGLPHIFKYLITYGLAKLRLRQSAVPRDRHQEFVGEDYKVQ